ncbi:MAG: EAL domain-containing protein [Pseudomonadota bacterium]
MDISAPLLAPEETVDQLIQAAVDLARIALDMDVGFATEVRNGVRIFRHVSAEPEFCPILVGQSHPVEQSYCQRIIDGSIPALVQDSHQVPELAALAATGALDIRAHVGVPVYFSDGKVFGTFCCYSRNPQADLSRCQVRVLRQYGDLIGRLMERRILAERQHEAVAASILGVLEEGSFSSVYQPIFNVRERRIVGYEALSRFHAEPARAPDAWFNDAHSVGMGDALEMAAIRKALAGLEAMPGDAYLALNVSPSTILSGAVAQVLAGQPLERLVLEVTEHSSIPDYGPVSDALIDLRSHGLRLAVDDAGSGYASFRHILKLKPDVIKLDQSLIQHIDLDSGCRALAAALIRFAEETGCQVVAEGVETEDELDTLRQLNVGTAQGFLLGRPGPIR